jgi:hypothetical protein
MYVLQLRESCCDADLESRDATVSFLRCLRADKKDNQVFPTPRQNSDPGWHRRNRADGRKLMRVSIKQLRWH